MRVFALDSRGILRGVTYPQAWRPGENIAKCLSARTNGTPWDTNDRYFYEVAGIGINETFDSEPTLMTGYSSTGCGDGNLNSMVHPDCTCGFYAYHNQRSVGYGVRHGARVLAVVEGYGKLVVGTLGYRAQKARIVAVVPPTPHEATDRQRRVKRAISDIDDVLAEDNEKGNLTQGTALLAAMGVAFSVLAPPFGGALLVGAAVNHHATKTTRTYARNQLMLHRQRLVKEYDALPTDYVETMALCRENYPDIEYYATANEMLGAHKIVSLEALAKDEEDNIERGDQ